MATFKSYREMTIDEIREVLSLMENQETTDRYENTTIHMYGNHAKIDVEIDFDGNVTLI